MKRLTSHRDGLTGERLRVRYGPREPLIIDGESLQIPQGKISALVGANGSGKSTLLKTLARQLPQESGNIVLDGLDIATIPTRELARKLGILFQERHAPGDLTVEELVSHGRYPHRRFLESLCAEDETAVRNAMEMAGIGELRHRLVRQLSGGQKQLAWIAMAVAQAPRYLLLDEPTTFLDMAHQFDVMDVLVRLNRDLGMSIVLVLHDLNLAARYADRLFALRAGKIIASGAPDAVLTEETLRRVFDVDTLIVRDEARKTVCCIPLKRTARAEQGARAGQPGLNDFTGADGRARPLKGTARQGVDRLQPFPERYQEV